MKIRYNKSGTLYSVFHSKKDEQIWHDTGSHQDRFIRAYRALEKYKKEHEDEDAKIVKIVMYDMNISKERVTHFAAKSTKTGKFARYLNGDIIITSSIEDLAELVAEYYRWTKWELLIREKGTCGKYLECREDEQEEFDKCINYEFESRENGEEFEFEMD